MAAWTTLESGREVALLLAALLLLCTAAAALRRPAAVPFWLGAGGLALAAALLWQGWRAGEWILPSAALPALAAKALLLPAALRRLEPILPQTETPAPSPAAAALAVSGIAAAAAWAVLPALGGAAASARPGLALALTVLGIGAWLLLARRDLAGVAAGAASLDNGLVLALLALPSWPLPLALLPPASGLLALGMVLGFAALRQAGGPAALRALLAPGPGGASSPAPGERMP